MAFSSGTFLRLWGFLAERVHNQKTFLARLDDELDGVADALTTLRSGAILTYTVATLPSANPAGRVIYISDEIGGAVLAFSDGTNWRRVTDRAIAS